MCNFASNFIMTQTNVSKVSSASSQEFWVPDDNGKFWGTSLKKGLLVNVEHEIFHQKRQVSYGKNWPDFLAKPDETFESKFAQVRPWERKKYADNQNIILLSDYFQCI